MAVLIFCLVTLIATHTTCKVIEKPNIVFISANDIGYNDISLHGSNLIYTPNIDLIGIQGIKLSNYYTDCEGTPSMSAMFTGKYPLKMGTQGPSIRAAEDRGVPISERLLPSYLKELGYATHFVGTWQNGKSRENYLPMNRGFDTFYGTTSIVDYFTYNHVEVVNRTQYSGLDLYHNLSPVHNQSGHITEIFTRKAVELINEHDPKVPLYLHVAHAAAHTGGGLVNLQATSEDIAANIHIANSARRFYAALVTGLDKSLGAIVTALFKKNLLYNTLIIFVSDNGAPGGDKGNFGSNLPLKGGKGTPWEGGVRSIAHLWHMDFTPNVWDGLFHVTDWVSTLIAAAAGNEDNTYNLDSLDGVNQWNSLVNGETSKRDEIIIAVDDLNEWGAFRNGDYKIIVGNLTKSIEYYSQDLSKTIPTINRPSYEEVLKNSTVGRIFTEYLNIDLDMNYALNKRDSCNLHLIATLNNTGLRSREFCMPTKDKGCLYNISEDPEESQDLWDKFPEIVQALSVRFRSLWPELVPRRPFTFDPKADPQNFNYVWKPWIESDEKLPPAPEISPKFPLKMTNQELQYYVDMNLAVVSQKLSDYMEAISSNLVDSISRMFR